MNWKMFSKLLVHAAVGGAVTGLATYTGGPVTARTTLLPALASAITSVFSLFSQKPTA